MHVGPLEVTAPKRNLARIARIWVGLGRICGEGRLCGRRLLATGSRDGSHDWLKKNSIAAAIQKSKVFIRG